MRVTIRIYGNLLENSHGQRTNHDLDVVEDTSLDELLSQIGLSNLSRIVTLANGIAVERERFRLHEGV